MKIGCEYGFYDPAGKIKCKKLNVPCGHVYFCQLSGTYKQTRQADDCPIRFRPEERRTDES